MAPGGRNISAPSGTGKWAGAGKRELIKACKRRGIHHVGNVSDLLATLDQYARDEPDLEQGHAAAEAAALNALNQGGDRAEQITGTIMSSTQVHPTTKECARLLSIPDSYSTTPASDQRLTDALSGTLSLVQGLLRAADAVGKPTGKVQAENIQLLIEKLQCDPDLSPTPGTASLFKIFEIPVVFNSDLDNPQGRQDTPLSASGEDKKRPTETIPGLSHNITVIRSLLWNWMGRYESSKLPGAEPKPASKPIPLHGNKSHLGIPPRKGKGPITGWANMDYTEAEIKYALGEDWEPDSEQEEIEDEDDEDDDDEDDDDEESEGDNQTKPAARGTDERSTFLLRKINDLKRGRD